MNASLADFQDAFARTLYGDAALAPGLAVYRNSVMKASIDALCANFPTVARLVGDAWFRAAAALYARTAPPSDARLLRYGDGFPAFLERFEPARALPYLANVARLDLLWIDAHTAADDDALDAFALASLSAAQLERAVLRPRASARWIRFDAQPAYTIWRANREGIDVPVNLAWHGEGALLLRPRGEVIWRPLPLAGTVFLDACAQALPFEDAAAQALEAEPSADFGALFGALVAAGAFARE